MKEVVELLGQPWTQLVVALAVMSFIWRRAVSLNEKVSFAVGLLMFLRQRNDTPFGFVIRVDEASIPKASTLLPEALLRKPLADARRFLMSWAGRPMPEGDQLAKAQLEAAGLCQGIISHVGICGSFYFILCAVGLLLGLLDLQPGFSTRGTILVSVFGLGGVLLTHYCMWWMRSFREVGRGIEEIRSSMQ